MTLWFSKPRPLPSTHVNGTSLTSATRPIECPVAVQPDSAVSPVWPDIRTEREYVFSSRPTVFQCDVADRAAKAPQAVIPGGRFSGSGKSPAPRHHRQPPVGCFKTPVT